MKDGEHKGRFKWFVLALLVLGAAVWIYLPTSARSFPDLNAGAYQGELSGLGKEPHKPVTLYLERLPNSPVVVLVAFVEGFRPQAVALEGIRESTARFAPLRIEAGDRQLMLSGELSPKGANGIVQASKEKLGFWHVAPIASDEVQAGELLDDQFRAWLALEGRHRLAKRELRLKQAELSAEQERRAKLQEFVNDERLLKERAAKRRDELSKELHSAVEERKASSKIIGELLGELDLLGRISRSGQAVNLARRVAHRENQWYQANWGEDDSSVPAIDPSSGSPIDAGKLEAAWKRATEVQALLRDLTTERAKNRELQLLLQQGGSRQDEESAAPAEEVGGGTTAPQKRSLWERIF
ncbi:MAG: hypothetical protein IT290_09025 [Deltaproteobacteria bacterium]|nr:hypothetical protein [Deltaproteobacteria bacterium]